MDMADCKLGPGVVDDRFEEHQLEMFLDGQEFGLARVLLGRSDEHEASVEAEAFIGKFDGRDLDRRQGFDRIDEQLGRR